MPLPAGILLEAAETRVTEFTWLSPPSLWFVVLVVVPALAAFATFFYRRERISFGPSGRAAGAPERSRPAETLRFALIALRVAAFLVLVGILAEPALRTTAYQNVDSTVLVLVDDSLSMEIQDRYADREKARELARFFRSSPETVESTSRYDLVRRLFRDAEVGLVEKLRRKARVVVQSFAAWPVRLREIARARGSEPPFDWNEPEVLRPQDSFRSEARVQESRIADCLLDAVAGERSRRAGAGRIAGVLLFSDGQQTPGARPIEEVAGKLGQRGIPVHAVGVGNPDEPKDIRVLALEVADVVLVGDQVSFDAALQADGFEGERVRVELKLDGIGVASEYALLEGSGRRQSVRLAYRPKKPGEFLATVEVEARPGELFKENNSASKAIKVLDEKIQVLYAEGPPRWEYRYLKNALIRDPTMRAQIFLFSADRGFVQESSPGVPPLARFPEAREEIFAYHVIILGDVDVAKELSAREIALLREFVTEAGGGLVFIAGREANPSKYLHTDLYALLPVELPEGGPSRDASDETPVTKSFNVELTSVGREHEVMRLDSDPARNVELWEDPDGRPFAHLPGFYWYAEVGRAKKGAVVLARHPSDLHPVDQKGRTVFAFINYGKGRVFFSGVDNTWRWRAGVDNQYFYRFWGQVIRFAATGRLLGKTPRFSIATDKAQYNLGETVGVDAKIFDADMKPSTERTVTAYVQAKGAEAASPETIELELDPVAGQGSYRGALVATRVGLHDIWLGTERERLAFRTFEVSVPALERRNPRRDDAALREIARLSRGRFYELYEVDAAVDAIEGESRSQEGDVETRPIWDRGWVLALFTGIIALEWILRKRGNLL
ncbi:MAG: hypothetical protein ACUVYA_07175 [Planctomycetota bacterium]